MPGLIKSEGMEANPGGTLGFSKEHRCTAPPIMGEQPGIRPELSLYRGSGP